MTNLRQSLVTRQIAIRTTAASAWIAGAMLASSAIACGFHNYTPQATLVDQLLSSDEIVLARAMPDNPYRYQPIQALEGDLASATIPHLVDSVTRRKLALDADSAVLFSRTDTYGPWQRIAFVDGSMAPILDTVMQRLPDWEIGEDLDRFSYFATLVGHDDDRIHRLALRELDLADYSILRDLDFDLEQARLLVRLDDPFEAEFKPIRILLLGLSGEAQQQGRLEAGLESSISSQGAYLGAYATALIELVGADAVTSLASAYLTDSSLPLLTRELLLEAVAMHGQTGDPVMEDAISSAIQSALWVDPSLAGAVARQFGARSDWSHNDVLQALLMEGAVHASADKQVVSDYVALAQDAAAQH